MRKRMSRPAQEGAGLECQLVKRGGTRRGGNHLLRMPLIRSSRPWSRAALQGGGPRNRVIKQSAAVQPPATAKRIWINFVELETERTQEYVLAWSWINGAVLP